EAPLLVIAPVARSIVTRNVGPPKSLTTPCIVRPSQATSALEIMLPVLFGEPDRCAPVVTAPEDGSILKTCPKSPSSSPQSAPLRSQDKTLPHVTPRP